MARRLQREREPPGPSHSTLRGRQRGSTAVASLYSFVEVRVGFVRISMRIFLHRSIHIPLVPVPAALKRPLCSNRGKRAVLSPLHRFPLLRRLLLLYPLFHPAPLFPPDVPIQRPQPPERISLCHPIPFSVSSDGAPSNFPVRPP